MTKVGMIINPKDVVVLDTETTGIGYDAEICQLSVIDFDENILFNRLIKTTQPIPEIATNIHGITNDMIADENDIFYYRSFLCRNILNEKIIFGYNISYDIRLIHQSFGMCNSDEIVAFTPAIIFDVMLFAKEILELTKWPRLQDACDSCSVELPKGSFHGALYDSIATLRLLKKLNHMSNNIKVTL